MESYIRDVIQPRLSLLIKIGIVEKRTAVHEIAAKIANGALDFPFGLRAIRPAGPRRKAPMTREAEKLRIADQRAAFEPQVSGNYRFHLIEEQLLRHAAKIPERVLEATDQRAHILAGIETAPEQA